MEIKKPKAILLKAKATYRMLPEKNAASLGGILNELNEALQVLDRRKTVIHDPENIKLLLADHAELLEFSKQVTLELYEITHDESYIDRLLSLHESGIYTRIRARLEQQGSIQFARVPAAVRAKEDELKKSITSSLNAEKTHNEKIRDYFKATERWNAYLLMLKNEYPRYYKMRYASVFESTHQLLQSIPENTTLVRYFFVKDSLLALVADRSHKDLVILHSAGLEKKIRLLPASWMDAAGTGKILHELYRDLWNPLQALVRHQKVIIIPDGILYNISFEALTPAPAGDFEDIAAACLLTKYDISYRYSSLLLGEENNAAGSQDNFIAFAPGFSDKIKAAYTSAVKDSMKFDNTYLSLLPLPFTHELAGRAQRLLGGESFTENRSTEASFKKYAGNHKIIYIGTHAESNNIHPEYSRLIFAKDIHGAEEDNSLFLPEIYNCDMRSQLTVLTACESGKPGYQDGEGMISLAHAFNYAGSKSILTALWKVDEQASAEITGLFYENLVAGLSKDEALRKAKLHYLQTARGRMRSPQYWAGLVVLGDTTPVRLSQRYPAMLFIIAIAAIAITTTGILLRRRNSRAGSNQAGVRL